MSADASGSRVTFGWVAGVLLTILLLLGGAVLGDVRSDLDRVQENQATRNEVQAGLQAEVRGLKDQMNRIEVKLDQALDRRPR